MQCANRWLRWVLRFAVRPRSDAPRSKPAPQVVPTSQAQARQRAGRAGREAPGKCFRLYPEAAFAALPATAVPEIQRSNLATVALQLKAVGVADVLGFEFLDPPPRAALLHALELLFALGAMVRTRVCFPPQVHTSPRLCRKVAGLLRAALQQSLKSAARQR